MASQIKKGFFFYFGLFVLVLVAIFMVCVVIMMFNPGSTVLWMQYFSGNSTIYVAATTDDSTLDGSTSIDFSKIQNVTVECGIAQVTVSYDDNDNSYKKSGVYVINNAKGFVTAAEATQFSYSVVYDGDSLVISVTEPNGFLYFSKDVEIVIHSSTLTENSVNLSNISFNITTTDGDVSIGGVENKASDVADLEVASLDVSTDGGDICLTKNFNVESPSKISLSTESGTIYSGATFTSHSDENSKTTGIKADCEVSLSTKSGRIELTQVDLGSHNLIITNTSGNVVLGSVYAGQLKFDECTKGNYMLTLFEGDNVFFGSENSVTTPYLDFGTIVGDFSLYAFGTSGKPTIYVDDVQGNLIVYALGGSLNVGSVTGNVEVNSDGALGVNVVVASSSSTISIVNNNAAIVLGFSGDMTGIVADVVSTSGNVSINFTSDAHFAATSYTEWTDSQYTVMDDGKITLNIGNGSYAKNPFEFGTSGLTTYGSLKLVTGANVNFNLVAAESL